MGYDSKGILVFNLKYEHAISFIKLVKFINYYQMPRSISSKLFINASGGGEANVYGSSYYWNFRTSSFKQVACLILQIPSDKIQLLTKRSIIICHDITEILLKVALNTINQNLNYDIQYLNSCLECSEVVSF
jgi:hypothetical protein